MVKVKRALCWTHVSPSLCVRCFRLLWRQFPLFGKINDERRSSLSLVSLSVHHSKTTRSNSRLTSFSSLGISFLLWTMPNLEVCQGPDCFGSGGGAAILEIEELVQEYNINSHATVVRGGCRNFCSMGPNVHFPFGGQHFSKVVGVKECHELIQSIVTPEQSIILPTFSVPTKLLLRQADRQRWQALRHIGRIQKSPTKVPTQQFEQAQTMLQEALEKEERAVKAIPVLQERALRRRNRLRTALQSILDENSQLSESEDEQDD